MVKLRSATKGQKIQVSPISTIKPPFQFVFLHYSVLLVYKVLFIIFLFVLQMNLMSACLKAEIYRSKIKFKNVDLMIKREIRGWVFVITYRSPKQWQKVNITKILKVGSQTIIVSSLLFLMGNCVGILYYTFTFLIKRN